MEMTVILAALAAVICEAESRRYLFRSPIYRKGKDRFSQDLDTNDDEEEDNMEIEAAALPWLNDEEFLQKYRMSHECFDFVLDLIKDHSVFKQLEGKSGRPQTPVVNQLMVFLKHVGTEEVARMVQINETHLKLAKALLESFSDESSKRFVL